MGSARLRPARLAGKLLLIRTVLGLSQPQMHRLLGVDHLIDYTKISTYELDKREPPLMILLEYARVANVYVEALIDDGLDLPEHLPSPTKSEGIRRKSTIRSRAG